MYWHGGGFGSGGMRGQLGGNLDEEKLGSPYNHRVVMRLFSYLRPYPAQTSVGIVALLLYTGTTVASPWIIKYGIDSLLASPSISSLTLPIILFTATHLVNVAANYVHLLSLAVVGQGVLYTLRTQMFGHLQRLSVSFFDRNEVGRIMSRVQNDVSQLQEFLSIGALTLGDMLSLIGIVTALFLLNVKLALFTLTVVPVLIAVMAVWQQYAWRSFMRVRRAIAVVNAGLQENIAGVRVVQAMNRERVNLRAFDQVNQEHLEANLQAGRLSAMLMPVVEILSAVAIGLVVVFGGRMVLQDTLAIGTLVAFVLYIQRFFEPIRNLTMQYTAFQRAMVSGVRIFELLDTPIAVQDAPGAPEQPPIRGDIKLERVSFHYIPGAEVLKDIDLEIKAGETVALVGPTGAGKTTIVSLIARFYDVTGGRLLIDDHDVRAVTRDSLARQMAIVLQEPFLFSGTIRDNIKFNHTEATDQQVEEAARVAGAHDFISRLPQGYTTHLEERGQNLSVGQRQLLSFARAVLADPRILMLDEATANIDSHTERLIQEALRRVLRGRTAIIIAHRLTTVRNADRIVVVEQGQIAEQGTHQELMALGGRYAHLYASYFAPQQALAARLSVAAP